MHAGSPRDAINVSNTNKDGQVLDVFSCVWERGVDIYVKINK